MCYIVSHVHVHVYTRMHLTVLYTHSHAIIAFASLSRKRERSPPSYVIHHLAGGMALPPPCPTYGVQQPQEEDGKKEAALCANAILIK